LCLAEARHVQRDRPPELSGRLDERRPVARGAGIAVHEHHGLPRILRSRFDHRRADAGDVPPRPPDGAHRAASDTPPPSAGGTDATAGVARPPAESALRAAASAASGTPDAIIRSGPLLGEP